MPPFNAILEGRAEEELKELEGDSIDLIVTDPPYGYSFMGKEWDKAVVSVETWKECLRVMKAGAFAFIMSAPRQDVLSRMIVNLQDAGFRTDFTSIYWTYASGFPKAANVSKMVDKRNGKGYDKPFRDYLNQQRIKKGLTFKAINQYLGYSDKGGNFASDLLGDKLNNRYLFPSFQNYTKLKTLLELDNRFDELVEREEAEREIIGKGECGNPTNWYSGQQKSFKLEYDITESKTEQAKKLDGSYAGFQPKPAVEVILTVMKPLSEKSFVDQALSNGKGITWLSDCRIPTTPADMEERQSKNPHTMRKSGNNVLGDYSMSSTESWECSSSRFPANLLVSDDALNDGKIRKKSGRPNLVNKIYDVKGNVYGKYNDTTKYKNSCYLDDVDSYSRYFSLDSWYDNRAQFIITPKASRSERNKGCEDLPLKEVGYNNDKWSNLGIFDNKYTLKPENKSDRKCGYLHPRQNFHPTVKPLKLMSYLITMGSRENDIVLDPFCGSGTTLVAAHQLHRKWIGIDNNPEYVEIARKRLTPYLAQQKIINLEDSST